MSGRIAIVGGGMAGLAAAVYLARAGRSVTVFERRRTLGGRAVTHLRQGYRFNLGPHAVYRGGMASTVYRELGVPIRGGSPPAGGIALRGSKRYRLPVSFSSSLATSLLSLKGKLEGAGLATRLGSLDTARFENISVREWLDSNVADPGLREAVEALIRLATYTAAPERLSAGAALRQLRMASRGVTYVHEGWQKIVDALHSHAVTAGVTFVTSSHVVAVDRDDRGVKAIELGELELNDRNDTVSIAIPDPTSGDQGTRIPTDVVILAVDPETAAHLLGDAASFDTEPAEMACLDVALSRLPDPKTTLALGIDRPLYFSVHSRWAQLTPKGGALIHAARYGKDSDSSAERELESLLDELQPGWREVLVHRRFLPGMIATNSIARPAMKRPGVRTAVPGLYLAGDWVGDEGMLSDAALGSARAAANAILADR